MLSLDGRECEVQILRRDIFPGRRVVLRKVGSAASALDDLSVSSDSFEEDVMLDDPSSSGKPRSKGSSHST